MAAAEKHITITLEPYSTVSIILPPSEQLHAGILYTGRDFWGRYSDHVEVLLGAE